MSKALAVSVAMVVALAACGEYQINYKNKKIKPEDSHWPDALPCEPQPVVDVEDVVCELASVSGAQCAYYACEGSETLYELCRVLDTDDCRWEAPGAAVDVEGGEDEG